MKIGKLKAKRKHIKLIKRCIVLSTGVSVVAAIICIPAFASKAKSEEQVYATVVEDIVTPDELTNIEPSGAPLDATKVSAGISSTLSNEIEVSLAKATIFAKEHELVTSAADNTTVEAFEKFVEEFTSWCSSNTQLAIDLVHTATVAGEEAVLSETHSQTDNNSKNSHVVTTTPKYTFDMWYNVASNKYYVNLGNDAASSNWVNLTNKHSKDLDVFIKKQITYNSSPASIKTLLNTLVESGDYILKPGIKEGSFSVTYETSDASNLPVSPTFGGTQSIDKWGLLLQKVDDNLFIDIIYNYVDGSSVNCENYSYTFSSTVSCNLDIPDTVYNTTGSVEELETIFNGLKEM